ncbi:MAG: hypothetical protein V4539_08720 [Bacteroidota bacterium]
MKTNAVKNKGNGRLLQPYSIPLSKETRYKILLGILHKRQISIQHIILDSFAKLTCATSSK